MKPNFLITTYLKTLIFGMMTVLSTVMACSTLSIVGII